MDQHIVSRATRAQITHQMLRDQGTNPRARGRANLIEALTWVYRWGWTSADTLTNLLGRTTGGYALNLEKKGLLRSLATASGRPRKIFTLTESGVDEITGHLDELLPYETDPHRVKQNIMLHDLLAQKITIDLLDNNVARDYITDRQQRIKYHNGERKIYDAICVTNDGGQYGIEVELSKKFGRPRDLIVESICNDITSGYIDGVMFVSHSPAIGRDYMDSFKPGAKLPIWRKNNRGHFEVVRTEKIPASIDGTVTFELRKI